MALSGAIASGRVIGDVLKYISHPGINYESGTLTNSSGTDQDVPDPIGQPVKRSSTKWIFVLAGDEANVDGLLIYQKPLSGNKVLVNGTDLDEKVLILVRGPALINADALPAEDVAGGTLDQADLETALEALGIISQHEPTKQADIEDAHP